MPTYNCTKCNEPYTPKKANATTFKCPACKYVNRNITGETQPQQKEQDINFDNLVIEDKPISNAETFDMNVEQINVEVPKIETPQNTTPITNASTTTTTRSRTEPIQQISKRSEIDPKSIKKYFEALDKMMEKKAGEIWDVTSKEEQACADLWADYLSDKLKDNTAEQNKLLVASATTALVYAPRVISYGIAVYNVNKEKRKARKKTDEEEQQNDADANLPFNPATFPEQEVTEEASSEWANKTLPYQQ